MNRLFNTVFVITCLLCYLSECVAQSASNGRPSSSTGTNDAIKCNKKTFKEVDAMIARMMTFGNSGRKFPENITEVPKYCNDTKVMVSRLDKLNKSCMKGLVRQVLSLTLYSAKKTFNQLCRNTTNGSKRMQEMIGSSKCLNKANDEIQRCYDNTIDHFLSLKKVDDKRKLPMACCAYHKKNICMSKLSDKVDNCSENQLETAMRFVDSISGNSLNVVCSDFNAESDKCDQFNDFKPKSDPKIRTKSFFLPLVELFDSFDEV